jgi:RND family efflux transporter MFP subunit
VDTVLVRPGAVVKKGDVLATLDCRNTNAMSQAVAMQARALETRQKAIANEATRVHGLLDGGFVSPNEAEQKEAQSASEQAQLLAQQAKLLGTSLEVNDCVLRAPFAGEIATRSIDPGAFVRPGSAIVSLVDRSTLRVTADAPEIDFDVVAPSTKVLIHVLATGRDLQATVSRRAPAADPSTRTVHFELDVPDPTRAIPVGTTGEIRIDVGEPSPSLAVPLAAAAVRGTKANLFIVDGQVARAHVVTVMGEFEGVLFLEPKLPPGAQVITEGRELLSDGDAVTATLDKGPTKLGSAASEAKGSPADKSDRGAKL